MFFTANKKGVRLEDLPPEAWTIIQGNDSGSSIDMLYSKIAWLYRCVQLRANGVMSMPFVVKQGKVSIAGAILLGG